MKARSVLFGYHATGHCDGYGSQTTKDRARAPPPEYEAWVEQNFRASLIPRASTTTPRTLVGRGERLSAISRDDA